MLIEIQDLVVFGVVCAVVPAIGSFLIAQVEVAYWKAQAEKVRERKHEMVQFYHETLDAAWKERQDFVSFHPRAAKLIEKKKNFVVVAEDEPYFMVTYGVIRKYEREKGTWTEEDEQNYRAAQARMIKEAEK